MFDFGAIKSDISLKISIKPKKYRVINISFWENGYTISAFLGFQISPKRKRK